MNCCLFYCRSLFNFTNRRFPKRLIVRFYECSSTWSIGERFRSPILRRDRSREEGHEKYIRIDSNNASSLSTRVAGNHHFFSYVALLVPLQFNKKTNPAMVLGVSSSCHRSVAKLWQTFLLLVDTF
ncbi:hypothetical protein Tcan_01679, partial [Toxocara canis]